MHRDDAAAVLHRLHRAQQALYRGGDENPVRDLLADSITWHVPGHNRIAGEYHGPAQVLDYMRRRRDLADATMTLLPRELLIGEHDHVASRTDGTATIGGVEHRWSTLGLYRLTTTHIHECWLLPLDPVAFDRIWS